jgi:alkanesulfonate monooxygenase SsuD/methylene tetrahydromethanopterin reductase-like flavin-dependent oxidoreductase (luciferase family)
VRDQPARARTGQLGDGWLALWVSPRRLHEAVDRIDAVAAEEGRSEVRWEHALQLWAGFGAAREIARERVSRVMEAAYALPFDRFERYVPCGPPEAVAEALAPYLDVGIRRFNFVSEAASLPDAIEAVAEVKTLLSAAQT